MSPSARAARTDNGAGGGGTARYSDNIVGSTACMAPSFSTSARVIMTRP